MTYALLVEIAWKSLVTSGITLLLLLLLRNRSAAERSWVAHAGLTATLLLPLAVFGLPSWKVEAPAVLPHLIVEPQAVMSVTPALANGSIAQISALPEAGPDFESISVWVYGMPAALLLLATSAAIFRLFALRRRASVLVEQTWLSALAHAQRRMGFKHGTALLVSTELSSPVSWGILRPIILLNEEAVASSGEAEAIIAHELAHVARLDWAKLLIARAATALFWFNPLLWMLARQCHQLREEAADDAVLGSDVPGVDYAALLVGAARHENRAMLLAANGVAPGHGSLKRRVTRVLDAGLRRTPARAAWACACSIGAIAISAPLSALSPVRSIPSTAASDRSHPQPFSAIAAMGAAAAAVERREAGAAEAETGATPNRVGEKAANGPAKDGRAFDLGGNVSSNAISNIAANATASAAAPARAGVGRASLQPIADARRLTAEQLVAMRTYGIDAADVRAYAQLGYRDPSGGDLVALSTYKISPSFIRELNSLGYRDLSVDQLTAMRIHGVSASDIREFQAHGYEKLSVDDLLKMRIYGVGAPTRVVSKSAPERHASDGDP